MAYEKQEFKDGEILTAEQLERMEDGIIAAQEVEFELVAEDDSFGNLIIKGIKVNERGESNG